MAKTHLWNCEWQVLPGYASEERQEPTDHDGETGSPLLLCPGIKKQAGPPQK